LSRFQSGVATNKAKELGYIAPQGSTVQLPVTKPAQPTPTPKTVTLHKGGMQVTLPQDSPDAATYIRKGWK
jgi:hypothetical protein